MSRLYSSESILWMLTLMIDTNSIKLLTSVKISFLVISHWWLPAAHSSASSQLQKICRWCRMPISAQIMTDLWTILRIIPKTNCNCEIKNNLLISYFPSPNSLTTSFQSQRARVSTGRRAETQMWRTLCHSHPHTHITNWMNCQNKWDNLLKTFVNFCFCYHIYL